MPGRGSGLAVGGIFISALAVFGGEMIWLAVIAAINMTLALYYYVKVIAEIYLYSPVRTYSMPIGGGYLIVYSGCVMGILGLGIWPGPLLESMTQLIP